MAVDLRKIKKLIELTKESGIAEIEIHEGEESVRISTVSTAQAPVAAPAPTTVVAAPATVAEAAPTAAPSAPEENSSYNEADIVTSPMVGTVYLSSTPGADPLVEIGQTVKQGEVICLVEAMKMFNQIEAHKSGTITARLVDNASPVEFGQHLFIIE